MAAAFGAAAAAGSGGVGVKVETASCWSAILVLSTIRGVPFIREIDGRTAPGCSAGTDIDIQQQHFLFGKQCEDLPQRMVKGLVLKGVVPKRGIGEIG